MTKADLIDEVSRLAELTRKDSEVIVETIFDSVVRSLRAGDKIEIRGFGSFRTRQRKPRMGRNPKTGEKVEVPAKKIFLDLVEANRQQLLAVGVPAKSIEASPLCTNCHTDLLFSYRAEKGKTGRMMGVVGIRA